MSKKQRTYVVYSPYGKPLSVWGSLRSAQADLKFKRQLTGEGCYLRRVVDVHPKQQSRIHPEAAGGFFCCNTESGQWVRNQDRKCELCIEVKPLRHTPARSRTWQLPARAAAFATDDDMVPLKEWCFGNE